MGDVVALLASAILVLAGAVAAGLVIRSGKRRRAIAGQNRERCQREELARIDDYIRRVDQATADAELDRLENERNHIKWDGLSSRSSSGSRP